MGWWVIVGSRHSVGIEWMFSKRGNCQAEKSRGQLAWEKETWKYCNCASEQPLNAYYTHYKRTGLCTPNPGNARPKDIF